MTTDGTTKSNSQHGAAAPATDPIHELMISDKIGGKLVGRPTLRPAEPIEPDPYLFAAVGGKFVGKSPTPTVPAPPANGSVAPSRVPADSPFYDRAAEILRSEPNLKDEQRSDLHDHFFLSKSLNDFADRLAPFDISNNLKHRLWVARAEAVKPVAVTRVDKVHSAIQKMVAIPKDVLDVAESHPAVLRALTSAKQ